MKKNLASKTVLRHGLCFAALVAGALMHFASLAAPVAVLQRGYDAGVTGADLYETVLNTANVTPSTFGALFALTVDDAVFAQPLYVPNLLINNTPHNVLLVATMSDTLYAFDADTGGAPLWKTNLASLVGAVPVPIANFVFSGDRGIVGNLGVLSTPVIDPSTDTVYAVTCTLENISTSNPKGSMVYRLHAIDLTTGLPRANSGVRISGSFGAMTFNPRYLLQRMSLVLVDNQVVFGFSAMQLESANGYTGWVMSYDKNQLSQTGVFAAVTTGNGGGGVWQSGRPPVVDAAGSIYFYTGNAYAGGYDGVHDFSESTLKLDPSHALQLVDWFTPGDWAALDASDLDLGSSGPMLIPGTSLIAGGGKTGDLYVLNTSNLGKYNVTDSQVVQKARISNSEFRGGLVFWPRSAANGGPLMYNWGVNDSLKSFAFNGSAFTTTPTSQANYTNQIYPGGILTLSANGDTPGSGIIWATTATSGDAENNPPVPGALIAFNAADVSQELWNSDVNPSRDSYGNLAKFVPPLVANGKVYVATWSDKVMVYGLLPTTPDFQVTANPAVQSVAPGQSAAYTIGISALGGFASGVTLSVSGVPSGVTTTFSPASVQGSGNSTLQVVAGGTAPPGSYNLTITGTSASTVHSTSVSLAIGSGPAPSIDSSAYTDNATASPTVSVSGVSTRSGGELLLAFVSTDYVSGANTSVTGMSGGGLAWSLVRRTNVQRGTAEIWRAFAPAPLNAATVTASLSHSVAASIYVESFSGVDASSGGAGAIGATGSASSSGGTPTGSLLTTRANSLLVGVGNDYDNAIARTPGAGQTISHQFLTPLGDTYWVQQLDAPVAASGVTATLKDTAPAGDSYNLSLAEVRAPAGPTYSISGSLTPATLTAGSSVSLTGSASAVVTADASGGFTFGGLTNGSYVITPSNAALTFTPASQNVVVNGVNVSGVGYTATANIAAPPVSVDGIVSKDDSNASATIVSPALSTTANNELVLALVSTDYLTGANTTVNSVSGGGLTWALIARENTQSGTSEIWGAFATSPLAGQAVTATLSQSVVAALTVMSFTGVDATGTNGAGAIGASATRSALSGAPSLSLVSTRAGSLFVGVGNDYDNAIARTPGTGQTIVHQDLTPLGDTYWVQKTAAPTSAPGETVTINDTSPTGDRYNLAVVEVRPP